MIRALILSTALVLGGCGAAQQIAQDEKLLPPTAAGVANAYLTIQTAGALGSTLCNGTVQAPATLPHATCLRLQAQLQKAFAAVQMVEALLATNESVTAEDTAAFTAAQAAIQSVLAQLRALNPKGGV